MIRLATLADIPAIIDMGRAMHAESPRYRALEFDDARVRALAERLIPVGCVFVGESMQTGKPEAMAACVVTDHFFSAARYVTDLILYVRPAFRGTLCAADLVRAIELAGAERGATECVLGISTEVHPEATAALYERLGYARSGISMRKRL